jgi:hypothetical protein
VDVTLILTVVLHHIPITAGKPHFDTHIIILINIKAIILIVIFNTKFDRASVYCRLHTVKLFPSPDWTTRCKRNGGIVRAFT